MHSRARWHCLWLCCLLLGCIPDQGGAVPDASTIDASPPDTLATDASALLAAGEIVFFTAGGAGGCARCHGDTGRGELGFGPDIRGKTIPQVSAALGSVAEMITLDLSPDDIEAVVTYLAWLDTQP